MTKASFTNETVDTKHPFLLMSSINTNAEEADTKELRHLKDSKEFVQIYDKIKKIPNQADPGMMAVYDLILALKAKDFSTCSLKKYSEDLAAQSGCTPKGYDFCKKCAFVSKVGKLASALRPRAARNASTYDCWPVDGVSRGAPVAGVPRAADKQITRWLDVIKYAEGIEGWKTSLEELLQLARLLNATLVEPCMKNGRLASCVKHGVPLSDVFDLTSEMEPVTPLVASYEEYKKLVRHKKHKRYRICADMHETLANCVASEMLIDQVNTTELFERLSANGTVVSFCYVFICFVFSSVLTVIVTPKL